MKKITKENIFQNMDHVKLDVESKVGQLDFSYVLRSQHYFVKFSQIKRQLGEHTTAHVGQRYAFLLSL